MCIHSLSFNQEVGARSTALASGRPYVVRKISDLSETAIKAKAIEKVVFLYEWIVH